MFFDGEHPKVKLVYALAYIVHRDFYLPLLHFSLSLGQAPAGSYRSTIVDALVHCDAGSEHMILHSPSHLLQLGRHIHDVCEGISTCRNTYLRQVALRGVGEVELTTLLHQSVLLDERIVSLRLCIARFQRQLCLSQTSPTHQH